MAPGAIKAGAGLLRVINATPEKYGEAILKNPELLNEAVPKKLMGQAYEAFEKYTGLKGLGKTMVQQNRASIPAGELEGLIVKTANDIAAGNPVDPQALYTASQAASHLKLAAKYGEPGAARAIESGIISQSKSIVDDALEKVYPEYGKLRLDNFQSKAREALSHLLPQNKNMSPNVLRTSAALSGAAYWAKQGEYGKAGLILGALSPAAAGMAIRGANLFAPAARTAANVGARAGMAGISNWINGRNGQDDEMARARELLNR